ncbi:MAG: hypothetical protein IKE57_07530 [Oscillospiraceae bacterium]|nr:hypothetical protein [Oscillospiraceae bacterium]
MFRFPGETIKSIAIIFFILNFLISLILGIAIIVGSIRLPPELAVNTLFIGVVIILFGWIGAFIIALFIYAFGALVSDVEEIKQQNKRRG